MKKSWLYVIEKVSLENSFKCIVKSVCRYGKEMHLNN